MFPFVPYSEGTHFSMTSDAPTCYCIVMPIILSPETERLLADRLKTGQYESADEVVRAALNALEELETNGLDEQTLDAIDRAEDQIERGEVHDWNDVREKVRSRFLGK